jgi:hypothetical protein
MESYFWADIPTLYSWEKFVVLIPDSYNKGMDAFILPLDDHLGEHHSMSAEPTQLSRPIFGGLNTGSVKDKLILSQDIGGSGLKTLHIRSVGHFGLSIATHYF